MCVREEKERERVNELEWTKEEREEDEKKKKEEGGRICALLDWE